MSDAAHAVTAKPPANFPKQAVVVIHGIGEQMPMDTIKKFVHAVWQTDGEITRAGVGQEEEVWSKPDFRTGSLELRRITTRSSIPTVTFPKTEGAPDSGGVRTDFYELYWADLSAGTTMNRIVTWVGYLLFRWPRKSVPRKMRAAWILLWIFSLVIVYLLGAPAFKPTTALLGLHPYGWLGRLPSWFGTLLGAGLVFLGNRYLIPYVGRVVRYTRATPDNIAARRDIRERGLKLLDALHDGEYERIIVVGHSLGAILGYDLINYFWASRLASHTFKEGTPDFIAFHAVEAALAGYRAEPSAEKMATFKAKQRELSIVLRHRESPPRKADGTFDPVTDRWLITDFVTLGSPLTHSDFLLTSDWTTFAQLKETREFPTCPPVDEVLDVSNLQRAKVAGLPLTPAQQPRLMSFGFGKQLWQMHHAAAFAATSWTNIYDPARWIFWGDIVSGPHAPLFGGAVTDVDLTASHAQPWSFFTHTKYWRPRGKDVRHILELRRALNLAGWPDPV